MNFKKYNRVYTDGCFDICHFGHYNFVRQASELGSEVYAGVHNDEVIANYKSPPVYNMKERIMMIEACKWVTKAVPNAPFNITAKFLDELNCDCSIHGDDVVVNENGDSCYYDVIKKGRFETVPRTKSISTTNLIGRILRMPNAKIPESIDKSMLANLKDENEESTTLSFDLFSSHNKPKNGDKIVYCFGKFDLLHPGHISFLENAKKLGDFLVVGIVDDDEKTIMKFNERVLNILAMKYVDDVVLHAEKVVTKELIEKLGVSVVVEGCKNNPKSTEQYQVPKGMGIYKQISSDYPEFTEQTVIHRILDNYAVYAKRNSASCQNAKKE